jgi:ketosteroid isomerase-like protein
MNDTAAMSPQLDRSFVESWGSRFAAAWNAQDPDAIASLCTEDVVWSDPAMSHPVEGREAVREFAAFTFAYFPDFKVEERDEIYISPIEPVALCPYRMSGGSSGGEGDDGAARNAAFALNAIDQWTFRGELMSRCVTHYNHAEMLHQLANGGRSG